MRWYMQGEEFENAVIGIRYSKRRNGTVQCHLSHCRGFSWKAAHDVITLCLSSTLRGIGLTVLQCIEACRVVVSICDVFLCSVLIDDVYRIGDSCIGDERKLNVTCIYIFISNAYRYRYIFAACPSSWQGSVSCEPPYRLRSWHLR